MNIPAHLIIGPQERITQHACTLIQQVFCSTPAAISTGCFCTQCRWVQHRQHPNLIWISPEKDYTLDDVEVIFDKIRFTLDPNTSFFFVLDKADCLTPATANRLLKVLEEPPAGYQFLLLATNPHNVITTIKSRCMVTELEKPAGVSYPHPLLGFFLDTARPRDPFVFEQELKKLKLNDTQSAEIFDELLEAVMTRRLTPCLDYLHEKARKLPQSGSSEIFWKSLWLRWPQ